MVLQAYIHTAVSKLVDLALSVKPYAVLNGGPAGHEPDLPAQTLLKAGRALIATAMDPTSGR